MGERILEDTTSCMQMCKEYAPYQFIGVAENAPQSIVNKFDQEHICLIPSTTPQWPQNWYSPSLSRITQKISSKKSHLHFVAR